jgi:nucleoid-associated protein YgaU
MPIGRPWVILQGMDYEYDGEEPYESRVLWGRVGAYAASLLVVFILGTMWGGRGSASESEVVELNRQVAELTQENVELRSSLDAASADGSTTEPPRISTPEDDAEDVADGAPEGEDGTGSAAGSGETRTYEVQSGDTLTGIAQRMYGDPQKFPLIAEANDLDAQLVVGQELIIPPDE